MKTIKNTLLYSICVLSLFTACSNQDLEGDAEETQENFRLPKEISRAIKFRKMNPLNFDYKVIKFGKDDAYEIIITQGDIAIPKDEFLQLYIKKEIANSKPQAKTEFIVNTKEFKTINLYAFVGKEPAGYALSPQAVKALRKAVDNWNEGFSSIKMDITVGSDFFASQKMYETFVGASKEAVDFGGFADFPDVNNSPGDYIFISPDANQSGPENAKDLEYLLTHELGHTIGFKHTDWNTRRSCVEAGLSDSERSEEASAKILGPLPLSTYDPNSIMNACFRVDKTSETINIFDGLSSSVLYHEYGGY